METQRLALLASLLAALLVTIPALTAAVRAGPAGPAASNFIHMSCAATNYPDLCISSLSGNAASPQNASELAFIAVSVAADAANATAACFLDLYHSADEQTASLINMSYNFFVESTEWIFQSLSQMGNVAVGAGEAVLRAQMMGVEALLNGALSYQQTSMNGLKDSHGEPIRADVSDHVAQAMKYTEIAIALVNNFINTPGV